ncbi:MAG: hypothetical protein LBP41_01675 [Holosporaceae bacterium]|jgi:serine/threonine-protein kinase|nr:hypothetical protein [Holosporaceae bacterium]
MDLSNLIENMYRSLKYDLTNEYEKLYSVFENDRIKIILSTLHSLFVASFGAMSSRLPTGDSGAHFWANSSRDLIKAIECTKQLQKGLKESRYSLKIDDYYRELISKCSEFLCDTEGSTIPPGMEKIELYYTIPIFKLEAVIEKEEPSLTACPLEFIGEGSYACVYKYKDNFYQKNFILKRAKSDLK